MLSGVLVGLIYKLEKKKHLKTSYIAVLSKFDNLFIFKKSNTFQGKLEGGL